MPSYNRYGWHIALQVNVPPHSNSALPDRDARVVVSLGLYEKKRTPDLVAKDGLGRTLRVLPRHERGKLLAAALMSKYLVSKTYTSDGVELNAD